jgi:hypothetical protein
LLRQVRENPVPAEFLHELEGADATSESLDDGLCSVQDQRQQMGG